MTFSSSLWLCKSVWTLFSLIHSVHPIGCQQTPSSSLMETFPIKQSHALAVLPMCLGDWQITCLENWKQPKVTFSDAKQLGWEINLWQGEKCLALCQAVALQYVIHWREKVHFKNHIRLELITDIKQCLCKPLLSTHVLAGCLWEAGTAGSLGMLFHCHNCQNHKQECMTCGKKLRE